MNDLVNQKIDGARRSLKGLRHISESQRTDALRSLAQSLREQKDGILEANRLDMKRAKDTFASNSPLLDRLELTPKRLEALEQSVSEVAAMEPVVYQIVKEWTTRNHLTIAQKTVPLGVIGFMFESRPNVLVDAAALCIKSGNALIAKGGSEAEETNQFLGSLIKKAVEAYLPIDSLQLISAKDRAVVKQILARDDAIDLVIPRGGEEFINFVKSNTRIPVIAHAKGLCHIYIHDDADAEKTVPIVVNAKAQRPGVCNALESLIIHKNWPKEAVVRLISALKGAKVEIRGDQGMLNIDPTLIPATVSDWSTEYLEKILSVKMVESMDDALDHIQLYGSRHTEGICTQSPKVAQLFETLVDASCVVVNASTRFNDGGELGIGPEIGISTSKLHAFGPMGARHLTTTCYVVIGDGHCRV